MHIHTTALQQFQSDPGKANPVQRHRRAPPRPGSTRCQRLIGPLPPGAAIVTAQHGLARLWQIWDRDDQVDIDGSKDQDHV
jgi:hypothetical protein